MPQPSSIPYTPWSNRPFITTAEGSRVWIESPLRQDELIVYWSPRPFAQDRYPTGWNVWRGVSPAMALNSPQIEKLNAVPVGVPMYRDLAVDTLTGQNWYYLVTEVFDDGAEVPLERPVTLGQWFGGEDRPTRSPVRIYREMRRRKTILLRQGGEVVDVLIRRRAGTRCPLCFGGEYESTRNSTCPTCFGTTWTGGFALLRDVHLRVLTLKEALKLQPRGLVLSSNPRAWLVDFPICRNGDVVVRRNGECSEIDSVDPMIHQGVLTEQNFELVKFGESHPIHRFDIPASDAVV